MPNSHDRRSAAHNWKFKSGNSFVDSAEARGSTKPQGRRPVRQAGVPGDVKIPDTYSFYKAYGQSNNERSECRNRQRVSVVKNPNPERDKAQNPGSF